MSISRDKVVKLDEINGGGVRFEDDGILGYSDSSTAALQNTLSKFSRQSHGKINFPDCFVFVISA